jgi:hypothetical protein
MPSGNLLSRRNFIRVAGGGVILGIGGLALARCDRMPEEAIAAWRGPDGRGGDLRRRLIAFAMLAPNPHNRQPWLVDLKTPGRITLYCDRVRLLPATDPYSRQILIGHGTFLELLAQAAAAMGYRADITYFPKGEFGPKTIDDRPVAEIALVKDAGAKPDPLFAQVLKRRTNREVFDRERPLSPATVAALRTTALDPAVRLSTATDDAMLPALRKLAIDGFIKELRTPHTYEESIQLMRIGASEIAKHRDGISIHGPMMWWLKQFGMLDKSALRDPNSKSFEVGLDMARDQGGSAMGFFWLTTADNSRTTQLKAGRAYVRLHLKATELGLAQQPMSQILQEYPEMAALQARFLKAVGAKPGETVQMLARLGYAAPVGPAPRRPLNDLILPVGSARSAAPAG